MSVSKLLCCHQQRWRLRHWPRRSTLCDVYNTARARYPGGAAITSLSRIRPEAGLDPLITTKEPAYFVIALPRTCVICRENYCVRSFSVVFVSSSRALGIARVHDRLRRELRVPFPLMRNFRKARIIRWYGPVRWRTTLIYVSRAEVA